MFEEFGKAVEYIGVNSSSLPIESDRPKPYMWKYDPLILEEQAGLFVDYYIMLIPRADATRREGWRCRGTVLSAPARRVRRTPRPGGLCHGTRITKHVNTNKFIKKLRVLSSVVCCLATEFVFNFIMAFRVHKNFMFKKTFLSTKL